MRGEYIFIIRKVRTDTEATSHFPVKEEPVAEVKLEVPVKTPEPANDTPLIDDSDDIIIDETDDDSINVFDSDDDDDFLIIEEEVK